MHHQDFVGESAGTGGRKMSHQSGFHHRRGSGATSAPPPAAGGNVIAGDDSGPQAGSSSPGLHHQLQSQAVGAQMKKKSGFQITSVTSAQINVSANNSLADDTESYDDMDESHTEDLSSSDMLDVSVSRATDTGVPERSSSDETLNSLHGVDTPGLASPNEPLLPQGSQAAMVNGTLHQHHQLPSQFPHQHGLQLDHSEGATPSGATVANSSPAMIPNSGHGPGKPHRIAVLNTTGSVAGTTFLPPAGVVGAGAEVRTQTQMVNPVSGTVGVTTSGPPGYDSSAVGTHGASMAGVTTPVVQAQSAALNGQTQTQGPTQTQQTQAPTGSRFRVVKLDTNSEPFRKGRWTCTEYYEKEIPHAQISEMHKASEVAAAETEMVNQGVGGTGQGPIGQQPPQTLQPHQQGAQDFTSPQAMQSPPQPLGLHAQMPRQDLSSVTSLLQQPMVTPSTAGLQVGGQGNVNPPAQVMPHQVPSQMSYPATQLPAGVVGRQPDFIQPTAPFQTQVQPPPPSHVPAAVAMVMGHGGGTQAPVGLTQQLPHQGQGTPAAIFTQAQAQHLPAQQPQHRQLPPNPQGHAPAPSTHGTPYVPLTALQADLQPLLTAGSTFAHTSALGAPAVGGGASLRTSDLEDAQRLLFKHRLEQQAAGTLAHMGMAAEASALMVAAAAGLRGQPAEGDEDSSSGASVVAIDNKIEQAMDLVKSHLMYAVREEVEVLKEQIKELNEKNSQLEQENSLLKTLASPEQMAQFHAQVQTDGSPTGVAPPPTSLAPPPGAVGTSPVLPSSQNSGPSA